VTYSIPSWRKSSYSGEEGGSECVEVAALWRKSSYSGEEGSSECVEVAALSPEIGIRDSKNPDAAHLHVSRAAFAALLAHVRSNA
jgi:uncharacterized protein DUF397